MRGRNALEEFDFRLAVANIGIGLHSDSGRYRHAAMGRGVFFPVVVFRK